MKISQTMPPKRARTFAASVIPDNPNSFWTSFPRQALAAILEAAPLDEVPQILDDRDRLDHILEKHPCQEGMRDSMIHKGVVAVISAALGPSCSGNGALFLGIQGRAGTGKSTGVAIPFADILNKA